VIRARVDALSVAIPLWWRTRAKAVFADLIALAGVAALTAILRIGADIDADAAALGLRLFAGAPAFNTDLAAGTLLAVFTAVCTVVPRVEALEAVCWIGARVVAARTAIETAAATEAAPAAARVGAE
jgi:energy-converting hydrogenase Eha subunit B